MIDWLHPAFLLIIGALLIPALRGHAQRAYRVALPAALVVLVFSLSPGEYSSLELLDFRLLLGRVDDLSLVFASVFAIVCLIGAIYALHIDDTVQHVAAAVYAGSALGVVFAGDLITLYVFWEMMVFSSVWLIWRRQDARSFAAGWRYLLVHAAGGVILLGGIILYFLDSGSLAFDAIQGNGLAFYLILLGFLINAAAPPLHAWLADAYPESTITGAIFLSALTTKTAVYTLIRGFPGTEMLIWLGAIMAVYGVIYAMLSNDIRRLMAYSIISQVGYMVAGVGMGSTIALNGAAAHAFSHILYKSLLFMAAGAIIHVTGKSRMSELGGLYRHMPLTFVFYMVGALSISAFPLFSGFVSKTMVVEAAAVDQRALIWLMLSLASAGTFLYTGLKLPRLVFFGTAANTAPPQPLPRNMLVAMAIAAVLCVFIGVQPQWLYAMLPAPVDYSAYTAGHLIWEFQVLLFTAAAFFLLWRQISSQRAISVDTDWFYRMFGPALITALRKPIQSIDHAFRSMAGGLIDRALRSLRHHYGPDGTLASAWPTGSMVLWVGIMLAVLLLASLF